MAIIPGWKESEAERLALGQRAMDVAAKVWEMAERDPLPSVFMEETNLLAEMLHSLKGYVETGRMRVKTVLQLAPAILEAQEQSIADRLKELEKTKQ